jgi:hypothetical protein
MCGKSLCESDIKKLNSQRNELVKKYKVCYKTLKKVEKSIKKGLYKGINLPDDIVTVLGRLPSPEKIELVDIICIADSISRSKLEYYYQIPIDTGKSLGEFVRQEILIGYDNKDRLTELSKLKNIFWRT